MKISRCREQAAIRSIQSSSKFLLSHRVLSLPLMPLPTNHWLREKAALSINQNSSFLMERCYNYVNPSSLHLIQSLPVSISLSSCNQSTLPYGRLVARSPVAVKSEPDVAGHKIQLNDAQRSISSIPKTRARAKSRTCKKENVNSDTNNAQQLNKSVKIKAPKKIKEEMKIKPITDYFPSQRSKRKTSRTIMKEKLEEFEEAISSGIEDGFEVQEYLHKGRGVVTTKKLQKGDFVLEYYGELITADKAKQREMIYTNLETVGCYMYYFTYQNKQFCIDATKETDRLGRLVNHSKKGNLKTKTFLIDDTPHLILVADRDIQPGEELLYDYGDRSKRSLEYYPWLAS